MTDKQIILSLTRELEAALEENKKLKESAPAWIPLKDSLPEISHNEIVIKNSRGWTRIVRFLNTIKHGRQFVDHYDEPLKGFNPTHYIALPSDGKGA